MRRGAPVPHALWLVSLVVWLTACQGETTAPAPACATRSDCPIGTTCDEAAGSCVPERSCATDSECCPGLRCIEKVCRAFDECTPTLGCSGKDELCDNGLCISATCGAGGTCSGARRVCIAGRCLEKAPCGGCAAGTVCEPVTGQCLVAPSGCVESCPAGTVALVTNGGDLRRQTCDLSTVACACVPLPALEPVAPSGYLSAVVSGDQLWVVGQDLRYGDVVVSRPGLGALSVLGVPDGPVVGDANGPRQGIAAPGPDLGRYVRATGHNGGLALITHEVTSKSTTLAVTDSSGALLGSTTLSSADRSGLGAAITTLPSGALVATWFTTRPTGAYELSAATLPAGADALSAAAWNTTTLEATTGAPKGQAPCGASCGPLEACLMGQAAGTGQTTYTCTSPDLAPICDPPCDREAVCATGVCSRIARRDTERTGVDAPGPETALTTLGEQPLMVAYSPRTGALELWAGSSGGWTTRRLDGGAGQNAGLAPAIAARNGTIAVAYEAESPHRVMVRLGATPDTLAVAPLSAIGGRDPDVAIDGSGHAVVVFGGAEGRGVHMASDKDGWTDVSLISTANTGRSNALVVFGGKRRVFTVEDGLGPRGLTFTVLELERPE
jgi:hypothetical protein